MGWEPWWVKRLEMVRVLLVEDRQSLYRPVTRYQIGPGDHSQGYRLHLWQRSKYRSRNGLVRTASISTKPWRASRLLRQSLMVRWAEMALQ